MRATAFLLLLAGLAGCRTQNGERLDYTSENRRGYDFFKGAMRDDYHRAKRELKRDLAFSSRRAQNRRIRREGVSFAWESAWQQTWMHTKQAWEEIKREFGAKNSNFRNSLFGLLDSGNARKDARYP